MAEDPQIFQFTSNLGYTYLVWDCGIYPLGIGCTVRSLSYVKSCIIVEN